MQNKNKHISCLFFFGCINQASLQISTFIKELAQRYPSLQVIGIQVPEYAFEKDTHTVRALLSKYNITFPVVLDTEHHICELYANEWLPRIYIIDSSQHIIFDHIGSGGYIEMENAIQQQLFKLGENNLPPIPPENPIGGGLCYRTSKDISLGYVYGTFSAQEEIVSHAEHVYTHKEKIQKESTIGIHGHWRIEQEYIEHTHAIATWSEYITFMYSAFTADIIVEPLRHGGEIYIELDGRSIPEDVAGEDIAYTSEGKSVVKTDFARIYKVIDADTYHKGILRIYVKQADMRLYGAFFGGCRVI